MAPWVLALAHPVPAGMQGPRHVERAATGSWERLCRPIDVGSPPKGPQPA